MLRSLKEIIGYKMLALDGQLGKVHDFYFDDQDWKIRYLVIDTGPWIFGRKVLITPLALGKPDWIGRRFPINLTREQIEKSPDIDTEKPVSKQQEEILHEYFKWPTPFSTPTGAYAPSRVHQEINKAKEANLQTIEGSEDWDPHLRCANEVIDYHVNGTDNGLGRVSDFILDDENWIIRYLVLDASELVSDKKVLIAPLWIESIQHANRQISIELHQQSIMDSPSFDPTQALNREIEEILYDYYGRPYYWIKR